MAGSDDDGRKSRGARNFRVPLLALALLAPWLAGCGREEKKAEQPPRPVRVVVAERGGVGQTTSLTGTIEAENEARLAFRISGRMIDRLVNVGDKVTAGQVIARLDPVNEQNALRSAQAALSAAQGQVVKTQNAFDRQDHLLGNGFTTRANHDAAAQALRAANSQLEDAEAQLEIAQDRVAFTELKADVDGTITARGAEPGEVVQAGQMIVQLARQDGRDAVFDVPAQVLRSAPPDSEITIRLTDDPTVSAIGRVREIAPQADAATRTFPVRVGINNPPAAMRLGSTVTGTLKIDSGPEMSLPASALTTANDQPAVFVVDPTAETVSLRNIEIARHDPATVIVASGLAGGEIVVTAGVQALHPGQKVRLVGGAS